MSTDAPTTPDAMRALPVSARCPDCDTLMLRVQEGRRPQFHNGFIEFRCPACTAGERYVERPLGGLRRRPFVYYLQPSRKPGGLS